MFIYVISEVDGDNPGKKQQQDGFFQAVDDNGMFVILLFRKNCHPAPRFTLSVVHFGGH